MKTLIILFSKIEDVVDETLFDGYIAPYAETPLDEELTGQSVYEDLLNSANKYVYIMTPVPHH